MKLDINRFFEAAGDGDTAPNPKVEFGGGGDDDGKDLFEDELEDALCVFKSAGDRDADIIKDNEAQILLKIDLENEVVFDKNEKPLKADDQPEEGVEIKMHPVLLN